MTVPQPARRLLIALIVLAIADRFVPSVRDRLEASRYEQRGTPTRFENSDFFGLGPLTRYLREHPKGRRPRTVFLGNSVLFGYGVAPRDSLPAVYERLSPDEKVLNASVNGLDLTSAYLIAKAMVDSVDTVFVLSREGATFSAMLPRLIPVDAADLQRFNLQPPPSSRLEPIALRWRLYRDSYRIQSALFGTSTRQYVYLHKGELVRGAIQAITGRQNADAFTPAETSTDLPAITAAIPRSPIAGDPRAAIAAAPPLVVDLAQLFRARGKRLVLLQIRNYTQYLPDSLVPEFNAEFSPFAAIAIVDVPDTAKFDDAHFTREGAAAAARELRRVVDAQR